MNDRIRIGLQALACLAGGGFLGFQALAAYDTVTTAHPWLAMPLAVAVLVGMVAALVAWSTIGDAKTKADWLKAGVRHSDGTRISDREADALVELIEIDAEFRRNLEGRRSR